MSRRPTKRYVGEIWKLQIALEKKSQSSIPNLKIMLEYIIPLQDLKALSITLDKQEVENYVNGATELDEDIDASRRKSYQAFLSEFDDSEDEGVDKDDGSGDEWGPDDSVKVSPFSNPFQISSSYNSRYCCRFAAQKASVDQSWQLGTWQETQSREEVYLGLFL